MGHLSSAVNNPGAAASLAIAMDRFVKSLPRKYTLSGAIALFAKGRKGNDNIWRFHDFIGDEQLIPESAFTANGAVTIIARPNLPTQIAHVRIPVKEAFEILLGFQKAFEEFLDSGDVNLGQDVHSALKQAERDAFEQRKLAAGNNPDWGSW